VSEGDLVCVGGYVYHIRLPADSTNMSPTSNGSKVDARKVRFGAGEGGEEKLW
jgi:hypothetical protein